MEKQPHAKSKVAPREQSFSAEINKQSGPRSAQCGESVTIEDPICPDPSKLRLISALVASPICNSLTNATFFFRQRGIRNIRKLPVALKIERTVSMKSSFAETFAAQQAASKEKDTDSYPCTPRRDPSLPFLNVIKDGRGQSIEMNHEPGYGYDDLEAALGSMDRRIIRGLLSQILNATVYSNHSDEDTLNFVVAFIKDNKPRDSIEATLLAQMSTVHDLLMKTLRRVAMFEDPFQMEVAERIFNKLARTYVSQVEALKRYRTGGEQKVTVQHVSVSEGGQAIVGNVAHNPRENIGAKSTASVATLSDERAVPMSIIEEHEQTVSAVIKNDKRE